jgi:hypothetical protein
MQILSRAIHLPGFINGFPAAPLATFEVSSFNQGHYLADALESIFFFRASSQEVPSKTSMNLYVFDIDERPQFFGTSGNAVKTRVNAGLSS